MLWAPGEEGTQRGRVSGPQPLVGDEEAEAPVRLEDREAALEAIGTSLHSIQDFFAHSNFVEIDWKAKIDLFNLKNPPKDLFCGPGRIPTTALTSGYWPDEHPMQHLG